jgi:hypothetical protein
MSKPFEDPSLESLIGVLRSDLVKTEDAARERISARLASGVLTQLFASTVLPSFFQRAVFKSKAFAVAVALPAGVAIGASGHAWLVSHKAVREPAAASVPVAAAAAAPVVAVIADSPPAPVAATEQVMAPSSAPAARVRSQAAAITSSKVFNRELSQLEKARTLLSKDQVDATLVLLRAHEARYPQSALEQERQALFIKALVAADKRVEARARAATFVRRFPKSTLRSSIEKAIASIP